MGQSDGAKPTTGCTLIWELLRRTQLVGKAVPQVPPSLRRQAREQFRAHLTARAREALVELAARIGKLESRAGRQIFLLLEAPTKSLQSNSCRWNSGGLMGAAVRCLTEGFLGNLARSSCRT